MTKHLMILQPLNQVFGEWWRRLQDPGIALAEFHRALHEGELIASLDGRPIARSYWRRARLEFDREEPLTVVVVIGDAPQRGRFYVSPAPHPEQHRRRRVPPAPKHAGGRPRSFTSEKVGKLQEEQRRYEKDHPSAPKKDVEQHLLNWAKSKLDTIASLGTVRKAMKAENNKN